MSSLIKEKFGFDRFERRKAAFFKKYGWQFMPFAQKDPLPDPHLLVPHQVNEVQKLIDAVKEGDLVSFVVSDIGMGKTALCKFLAEVLPAEDHPRIATVFLHCSSIETPEQMLRLILSRLELQPKENDIAAQFEQLYRWHEKYPDLLLTIIFDEFPDLNGSVLNAVRTIADLRGVVLILNGQKYELLKFVEQHSPALLQRKRLILELKPLGPEEVEELLALRLAWARGGEFNDLTLEPFTKSAVLEIHRCSRGIPREALKLAGDATYLAIEQGSSKITHQVVRKLTRARIVRRVKAEKAKPRGGFLKFLGLRR
ncbi:MAG: AAA family ATPase [Hadesarchaea archaeon]|nr:AAA family ATPase [Hadesarchaea archaeon]